MRTIKFREWDQAREDMIPGHGMSYSVRKDYDDEVNFVFAHYESDEDWENNHRVLEQYTGLKDVNGKDIYEGDILKVTGEDGESYVATVKWFGDEYYPAFDLEGIPAEWNYDANALATIFQSGIETCEVIGNIHEKNDCEGK